MTIRRAKDQSISTAARCAVAAVLAVLSCHSQAIAAESAAGTKRIVWSAEPVVIPPNTPRRFFEGLWGSSVYPLGNGRLGCTVFGGIAEERIQFNEDTLWTGDEAETGAFQNFGDVFITIEGHADASPSNCMYRRELDIEKALHTVTYEHAGTRYRREYFASHPANVMVFSFTADKKGAYTGTVSLRDAHPGGETNAAGGTITLSGALRPGQIKLTYEAQAMVLNQGGSVSAANGVVSFKGCDSLLILLDAGTDYLNQRDKGWKQEHPYQRIVERLAKAATRSFDDMLAEHIKDYQRLFNRVTLQLGDTDAETLKLSTGDRLKAYQSQKPDPDLEEMLFQYARYLMVSSSRPGDLPATLQGIWNPYNWPPWRSDYHTDVNVEMNYWFVDAANLSECFQPLAEWVNSIREVRREATKKEFNVRGWATRSENGMGYHPYVIKRRGEEMFCLGINHVLLHVVSHQPRDEVPGYNPGFGTSFHRNNPWFNESRDWVRYLQRVHFLLQQGNPAADVAVYIGDFTPQMTGPANPVPAGYDFDYIGSDAILSNLGVVDGKWVVYDEKDRKKIAAIYELLVMPNAGYVRPQVLKRLEELKQAGGKVPAVGAGQALQQLGVAPLVSETTSGVRWKVRQLDDGMIFFLSNFGAAGKFEAKLRVTGKVPELYNPVTGEVRKLARYKKEKDGMRICIQVNDPADSFFVVFREAPKAPSVVKVEADGKDVGPGDLALSYDAKNRLIAESRGKGIYQLTMSDGTTKSVTIDQDGASLPVTGEWATTNKDEKGFSVFKEIAFSVPAGFGKGQKVELDLGKVEVMAQVTLNGKEFDTLWMPPFVLDVTDAVKSGENKLKVLVTSTSTGKPALGDVKLKTVSFENLIRNKIMMKRMFVALVMVFSCVCADQAEGLTTDVEPTQLRCEYLENPLGIDVPRPRLSWKLEAGDVRGIRQTAYQVLVASSEKLLKEGKADLWDSGKVESEQSLNVEYAGKSLESLMRCFWKVKVWTANSEAGGQSKEQETEVESSGWSKPAIWTTGVLKPGDLGSAKWIKSDLELYEYQKELKKIADHDREAEAPMWERAKGIRRMTAGIDEAPAVWLRKEFSASGKPLRSARVCVSGLGFYELYINGRKVNDHCINCAPYDYDKAVPYQVHDVTRLLRGGTNAIGVILGNGYFNPVVPSLLREYAADFIDTPRMLLGMVLEYEDGSVQRVVSDGTWKFTTGGPIRFNSVRAGETYDARRELGDWSSPGYSMESWKVALAAEVPTGGLVNQNLPPVRRIAEIPAASVVKNKDGYRFDIGVEATGWARLKVRGRPGQEITIRYPGVDSHTLGRYQECRYLCRGSGEEIYEPRFAFNGYRFVEVSGLDYEPKPSDLVGCEVVCDLKSTGQFSCSSPELNKIQEVILRTILNYNIQIPMDPVREKVGWTQDVQSNFKSTACNFDVSRIYTKWQEDFVLSIQADGYVPTVVPGCFDGPTINGPWWGGMIVYNPWQLYNFYGDRRILERSYEPMKHYISYLDSIAKNNIISWGLGDWMDTTADCKQGSRPNCTTVPFTSTCAYMMYHDIIRRTALLLDKKDDAVKYGARVEEIRAAINGRFFNAATGVYDKGSQTGHVLALVLGVPEEADRPRVAGNLKAQIASDGFHVTSGFVGIPILLTYLTEHGMGDLAWRIATRPTYPGWFDMIFTLNNSVLKEDWAGKKVQMPSLAAPIGEWFYRCLGGIRPDAPGFKHFVIQPYTATLDWVKCEQESPYGLIRSNWSKKEGVLTMEVIVPPNTAATVYVPVLPHGSFDKANDGPGQGKDAVLVTESGRSVNQAKGVKFLRMKNGAAVYEVGSGCYKFETQQGVPK